MNTPSSDVSVWHRQRQFGAAKICVPKRSKMAIRPTDTYLYEYAIRTGRPELNTRARSVLLPA